MENSGASGNSTAKRTDPVRSGRRAGSGRGLKGVAKAVLISIAAILLVLGGAIAILLIDANFLRAPIARYLSDKLDRSVAINGNLRIRLFKDPRIEVNQVALGNAEWGSRPTMVDVERAVIRFRVLPLFQRRVVLPGVELTKPDVLLETNADGDANWRFGKQPRQASTGTASAPEIHALWIQDGRLQFRDPSSKSDVVLQINSDRAADSPESVIKVTGKGQRAKRGVFSRRTRRLPAGAESAGQAVSARCQGARRRHDGKVRRDSRTCEARDHRWANGAERKGFVRALSPRSAYRCPGRPTTGSRGICCATARNTRCGT